MAEPIPAPQAQVPEQAVPEATWQLRAERARIRLQEAWAQRDEAQRELEAIRLELAAARQENAHLLAMFGAPADAAVLVAAPDPDPDEDGPWRDRRQEQDSDDPLALRPGAQPLVDWPVS